MSNRVQRSEPEPSSRRVPVTHPEKVLYPEDEITKEEIAEYYQQIADTMLPFVIDRPLTLVRCPEGIEASCFYQKHPGSSIPDLPTEKLRERGRPMSYGVAKSADDLTRLVQANVLEIHAWGSTVGALETPDQMVLDLDPGPGVDDDGVVDAAILLGDFLREVGLESFVRLTGGKGIHLVVPLVPQHSWEEVKGFSQKVAASLAHADPSRFVAVMTKSKREGKIFVDYLRNNRGATAIMNYSTRARPGAPVATPIDWDELREGLHRDRFTLRTVPQRVRRMKRKPWKEFFDLEQSLPDARV